MSPAIAFHHLRIDATAYRGNVREMLTCTDPLYLYRGSSLLMEGECLCTVCDAERRVRIAALEALLFPSS